MDYQATGRLESAASKKQAAKQAAPRSKPGKTGKKPVRLPPEGKDLSSWYVHAVCYARIGCLATIMIPPHAAEVASVLACQLLHRLAV